MRRMACLCVLALFCAGERECSSQPSRAPQREVEVSRHPTSLGTEFVIEKDGCRIGWTVLANEPGVVRHRSDCALTPAVQAPLLQKILDAVLRQHMTLRALDWGRLFPDGAEDTTMPVRLAAAAHNSTDWDAVRGKARSPDLNGAVRKLANEAKVYEELRSVFQQAGLELTLASVEKVLVMPAADSSLFERLKNLGVDPKDRVPIDFQAWFSISPLKPVIKR